MAVNNKMLAIAIVVILIVVAVVVAVVMTSGGHDDKTGSTGRLQVYGNADNDDYLDKADIALIQDIVDKKTSWDKTKNPYADANGDGSVTSADVTHLQNILDGKECLMYYTNFWGDKDYVHYPIKGNIGANYVYGLQVGQTLGFYDRITGAIDSVINNYDEKMYPGLKSLKNLGSDKDSAAFADSLMANNISAVIGFYDQNLTTLLHGSGSKIDVINLPYARVGAGNPVDAIMTSGALFGCLDDARKYAKFYDDTYAYTNSKTSELPAGNKAVIIFNPNNNKTVGVDTYGADGTALGDAWVIFNLPLIDNADHTQSAYVTMQVESKNIMEADYLFIVLGTSALNLDSTIADGQKVFDEKCEFLKGTKAYQNKAIYGVGFVPIGTYMGVSQLGLLANAMWPGSFDESKGYSMLSECYNTFGHVPDGYDFKNSGYFHVYSMKS